MWISKGEYELFFKVLIRHFLCSWQSPKTPSGGSFGHPRQEECLCLTIHIDTALHLLLSVFFTAHRRCQAQIVAQDTEKKHGKHCSGAPLSSVPLILGVVLAEHGGCLSSVDRDRELRIWNEREARRHECETRGW